MMITSDELDDLSWVGKSVAIEAAAKVLRVSRLSIDKILFFLACTCLLILLGLVVD